MAVPQAAGAGTVPVLAVPGHSPAEGTELPAAASADTLADVHTAADSPAASAALHARPSNNQPC